MKILFSGSRDYKDIRKIFDIVYDLMQEYGTYIGVHGNQRGADLIADLACKYNDLEVIPYPANWSKYGNAAGGIRNREMYDKELPNLLVAFPLEDSIGTWDMINYCRNKIPILIYMPNGEIKKEGFIDGKITAC